MNSLSQIAFEQIRENYYWGAYGPFRVIIDITTGYINATHLCGLASNKNGKKKEFRKWLEVEVAKELIDGVSSSARIQAEDQLRVPTDLPNELRGTYAHPKLIPHIASWASPKFAIMVSDIVNEYLVREYKESIRVKNQTIDRLEITLAEIKKQNEEQSKILVEQSKDNAELKGHIATLLAETAAAREENSHVLSQLDVITTELENTSVANDELTERVVSANVTINSIAAKLDVATDQRVPPARRSPHTGEMFAVYKNPTCPKYYMLRRQLRTMAAGVANCGRSGYIERVYASSSPNSVNLGVRMKDILPPALGRVNGTIITLSPGKSTADLLEYIARSENEKKEI
jgi:hypothetical protein